MSSILHKLRAKFLSPGSNLELRLRTLYHRFSATRPGFKIQDWRSRHSYKNWRFQQESIDPPETDDLAYQPNVSFLLNCPSGDSADVMSTIHSILNLSIKNWEILLLTADDEEYLPLPSSIKQDEHIKQINKRQELEGQITGDFLVFSAPGDRFSKHLLAYLFEAINRQPAADIIYFDCEYTPEGETCAMPFFKPDAFSPELLLSVNYLSRAFINMNAVNLQHFHKEDHHNLLAAEYDMILRLVEADSSFEHIAKVLVSQKRLPLSADPGNTQVILSHLRRIGRLQPESKQIGDCIRFSWMMNDPSIAIIIPTKNHPALLNALITSILEKTEYENFTINLVDNDSDDEEVLLYYESLKHNTKCSILPYHGNFNYSTAINLGVENTKSDLVLLLNDDMEILDPCWLAELAQWAILPEIGVVGARLLRKNRALQHAGIIIGLNGFAGHIYLNAPEHFKGLFGSADWYRDYFALTGACQMVRRELFTSVGGYDKGFRLAFGDIDFCLRVNEKGFRNIYTPFANICHYEGYSRGYATPIEDIRRGYDKLETYLQTGDQYYSPNLSYTRIPRCINPKNNSDERMIRVKERRAFYKS